MSEWRTDGMEIFARLALLPIELQDRLRLRLVGLESPRNRLRGIVVSLHQRLTGDVVQTLGTKQEGNVWVLHTWIYLKTANMVVR